MTEYFYVLGLPRSRTLWLSYVLSDADSKCYHEALSTHGSQLLDEVGCKYIGSVDTNPLLNFDYNGRFAIVKRDVEEVKQSVINWFKADQFTDNWELAVDEYINKYNEALNKKDAYIIDYDDLNNVDELIKLIKHLKPEAEINKEHLLFLQNCIIKTKNKDLTGAINHTSRYTGESLASVRDIRCNRTFDVGYCFDVLTNPKIFDEISEDGANIGSLKVDVIKDYWLEITDCGVDIGVVQLKPIFNKCWEAHIHILPEHRKEYAIDAGYKIRDWIIDNLKEGLIYTNVPVICEHVKNYLLSFGFKEVGLLEGAWLKNREKHDMWILTRSIK